MPPAPLPPKKNSILITRPSTTSLRSKGLDSPLPILPIMAEAPRPRAQAGPILRKPVALLPTPPATAEVGTKSKAMKRQSSISSLLSAYSRSSSDWAQVSSSHESDYTKDSEPSYSPEHEGMKSLPPVPSKKSMETTNDTNSDRTSEVTSYTIIDSFPPPPPLKDPSRSLPRTPRDVRPVDGAQDREVDSASLSSISLRSGSPRGREIWRRRASSKSDAGLVIAELKLPSSNGSTASTSQTPAAKAEPPSLLPPLPAKTKQQPALPLPPPPPPQPPKQQQQPATAFPPRTTSVPASLPGRNIRPVKKAEPVDEDDEMKKFLKLSKLKELVRHGDSDEDDDGGQKRAQKKREEHELSDMQNPLNVESKVEADKPELPAKDNFMQNKQQQYAPRAAAGESSQSLASPPGASAPPPNESGKAIGTPMSRRPVGAVPAPNPNQLGSQLGPNRMNTTGPNLPLSATQATGSLQPSNPVGTLPHPRQRQQQTPRAGPAYPFPRSGPTSPTGGTPRSVSTFSQPNQSAAPTGPMAGFHRGPPGAMNTGSPPYYQSQASKQVSPVTRSGPERGSFSPRNFTAPPQQQQQQQQQQASSGGPKSPPFLPPPAALNSEQREEANADQPMSAEAAAAVGRFPRKQNWSLECTIDGIWPPNVLTEQHYNCFSRHTSLMNSRNTNYALACQTCGVADKARRCMCSHCNLRICIPCTDLLVANGRDLRATMKILKEQGKIRDWSDYRKQGGNQKA